MKLQHQRATMRGGTLSHLIFAMLALGLCGLVTFQFRKEGKLRVVLEDLSLTNAVLTGALIESRKEVDRWKGEVSELSVRLAEAEAVGRTNKLEIGALSSALRGSSNNVVLLTKSRDAFKERFEEQAEITRRATEATKKLKAEAEAEIQKIAAIAEERTATANKYAKDYKDLVETFETFRAQAQAKPPTTPAPTPPK